jgi:hypothetical protein
MSFDWLDYLIIARQLYQEANQAEAILQEGKYRIAISRAYYAAYIIARNHLRDVDKLIIPPIDAHRFVIKTYADDADPIRVDIGDKLQNLKTKRIQADYQDKFRGDIGKTAQDMLRIAEETIALISTLQP